MNMIKGRELTLDELMAIEGGTGLTIQDCVLEGGRLQADGLWGMRFRNCQFHAVEFVSCDLQEALFEGCSFMKEMTGSTFRFCDLKSAQFQRCDLSLSLLLGCEAYDISFVDCRLRGLQIDNTGFTQSIGPVQRQEAEFKACQMEDALLSDISLVNARFMDCSLRNADLENTDLTRAEIRDCDLYGAAFKDTDLTDADLRGSQLDGLDLTLLRDYRNLTISASQQHHLLASIGIHVTPD